MITIYLKEQCDGSNYDKTLRVEEITYPTQYKGNAIRTAYRGRDITIPLSNILVIENG